MMHGHVFWDVLYMYNTDHVMAGRKVHTPPTPHGHGTAKFNQASRRKAKRG